MDKRRSQQHTATARPRESEKTIIEDASLLVLDGPDSGAVLELALGTHVIGSASECDLQLSDPEVSRRHLELVVGTTSIKARDLGSKNGSFFLGSRFDAIAIRLGATVRIGQTEMRVLGGAMVGAEPPERDRFGPLLGQSVAMRRVFALLERLARSELPVLITGETGTGKDVAARALHAASSRGDKPFVVIDLAGLTDSLVESELFGHVRGAFTGAVTDRVGGFEQAGGGSVFLDEIGEMSLAVQPRLLRVLESRQVKPIGQARYRNVDARFIAATHRDLPAMVEQDRFRADLYHRLAVASVAMPPLRDRPEDIPLLIDHVIAGLRERDPEQRQLVIPDDILSALCGLSWPGNVRQLRNVMERAYSLVGDDRVVSAALLGLDPRTDGSRDDGVDEADEGEAAADEDIERVVPVDLAIPFKQAKEQLVQSWEREYISALLAKHDGHISRAARDAGIDRVHLHRLLKKHGFVKRYR